MRIAIVHSFYAEGPSGENLAVKLQVDSLRKAGHDVRVVSKSTTTEKEKPVFALKAGWTVATGFGPSPVDAITSFKPDVIHVHNLFPNWSERWVSSVRLPLVWTLHNFRPLCAAATLFLNGSPCSKCPTSGSFHSILNRCYQGSRVKTIPLAMSTRKPDDNRLLNRANGIVFLNADARDIFLERIPAIQKKETVVIPNFAPRLPLQEITPPRKVDDTKWLFVGRLAEEKGILELAKAWPANLHLRIIGSGPEFDNVVQASSGKNIELLGPVDTLKVQELLRQSCGLVFPSLCKEHSPMVFVEAMRAGIPVLAKSGNSVAKYVQENRCGVVFEEFAALHLKLEEIYLERQKFSQRALHLFDREFSEPVWLRRTEEAYSRAIDAYEN